MQKFFSAYIRKARVQSLGTFSKKKTLPATTENKKVSLKKKIMDLHYSFYFST